MLTKNVERCQNPDMHQLIGSAAETRGSQAQKSVVVGLLKDSDYTQD